MTKKSRSYRFLVAKPGEGDLTESTNIDLDVSTTDPTVLITGLDSFGGQRVRGVEAHAESLPWTVTLQESTAEEVTSKLATSTLLSPDMMRRTCRLDVSGDGGFDSGFDPDATDGFQIGAGGRVTDLAVNPDEQTYEFTVRDELFKARTAAAFSSNNTQIWPRGPSTDFWRISGAGDTFWRVVNSNTNGKAVVTPDSGLMKITQDVVDEIIDDEVDAPKTNQANFRNLQIDTVTNTFGVVAVANSPPRAPTKNLKTNQTGEEEQQTQHLGGIVINATTNELPTGPTKTFTANLNAFGRDPSTVLPLHFGGVSGLDPMQFVKDRYDDANVRTPSTLYQTHSTNKPNAILDHPLKLDDVYFRITEPTTSLQEWLERNLMAAHGVAPLVDEEGQVLPQYVRQPDRTQIPATSNLFTFTSTNIADRHPTWDEGTNEQVTKLDIEVDTFREDFADPPESWDFVKHVRKRVETTHATSIFGVHERRIRLRGIVGVFEQASSRIAHDVFQRFGYGPIRSRFRGMSDASTVRAGDFVVLDVPTLPKAPDAVRGGPQIFQVLSRTGTVRGPRFETLELGPEAQPLSSTLSLQMTKSSTEPRHAVRLSVSDLPSAADAQVRLAAQSSEPADNTEWTLLDLVVASSGSTQVRGRLPSGKTVWGQARASKSNRIHGDWSTSVNVTLDSIPGPTTLTVSSTRANRAEYRWNNGTTEYGTHLIFESTIQKNKPAGSEIGVVYELSTHSSTETLNAAVQHFDEYGGKSSQVSDTFSLSTNAPPSPDVKSLSVVEGFFSGSGSTRTFNPSSS